MGGREISQRHRLRVTPAHGHKGDVGVAHDGLAKEVQAVEIVQAVFQRFLRGEVGEVVGFVHVVVKAFLARESVYSGDGVGKGGWNYNAVELVVREDHGKVSRTIREEDGLVEHAEVAHCLFWDRDVGVFK